jgi:ketosteroid isomerase-like protein
MDAARQEALSDPQGIEHARVRVVDAFLEAYNAKDLDTVSSLLGPDIRMVHYGRDIDVLGRDEVVAHLSRSAQGVFPDRVFQPRRRQFVDGRHVVIEHTWAATATADVPQFARAGEAVNMELCTIFTIDDGQIVEYVEYG